MVAFWIPTGNLFRNLFKGWRKRGWVGDGVLLCYLGGGIRSLVSATVLIWFGLFVCLFVCFLFFFFFLFVCWFRGDSFSTLYCCPKNNVCMGKYLSILALIKLTESIRNHMRIPWIEQYLIYYYTCWRDGYYTVIRSVFVSSRGDVLPGKGQHVNLLHNLTTIDCQWLPFWWWVATNTNGHRITHVYINPNNITRIYPFVEFTKTWEYRKWEWFYFGFILILWQNVIYVM